MTPLQHTSVRLLTVALSAVALPLVLAGPAHAEVPEGWSDPAEVPVLEALLILGGIPLGLALLIALAVYVPAMVRGEHVAPGAAVADDQWFGGPREGTYELEAAQQTQDVGGASGRW